MGIGYFVPCFQSYLQHSIFRSSTCAPTLFQNEDSVSGIPFHTGIGKMDPIERKYDIKASSDEEVEDWLKVFRQCGCNFPTPAPSSLDFMDLTKTGKSVGAPSNSAIEVHNVRVVSTFLFCYSYPPILPLRPHTRRKLAIHHVRDNRHRLNNGRQGTRGHC
jgi:hypothetical protein